MEPLNETQQTQKSVQTVTFFDEGGQVVSSQEVPTIDRQFLTSAEDKLQHSVKDFLQRPLEIRNFTWPLAATWGTELPINIELPVDWLSIPMIKEKLSGFLYLRCNFRIKIQVNAQPFHAGRLIMVFNPVEAQLTQVPSSMAHFGGVTGYRNVCLDLSEATSADIIVPFLMNVSHFDLVKGIGLLGSVRLFVYSALTGSTDVDGTAWVSAENVEIHMATGVPLLPRIQAGGYEGTPQYMDKLAADEECRQERMDWQNDINTRIETANKAADAMARSREIPIEAVKATEKKSRLISKVLTGIGFVGRGLGAIPVIGTAASAIGWVASAAGGIASLFGWSKPSDPLVTQLVQPAFQRNFANYDGDSKGKMLALSSCNSVVHPAEVFGTNVDEMAISSVISRPVYTDRFTYNTTQKANQVIWRWPVSPSACGKGTVNISGTSRKVKLNTYLSYLAEMFGAWRGSINYHFKIVKTSFHTGRIRISYIPSMYEQTAFDVLDVNKIYSQVYDIRETTSIDFEVPFVFHQPWNSLINITSLYDSLSETLPTGVILVEVLNSLRGPSTVAQHIEFIVETSGGSDFQFAYPEHRMDYVPLPSIPGTGNVSATGHTVRSETTLRGNVVRRKLNKKGDFMNIEAKPKQSSVESRPPGKDDAASDPRPVVPVAHPIAPDLSKIKLAREPGVINIDADPTYEFKYTIDDFNTMWENFIAMHPSLDTTAVFRKVARYYPLTYNEESPWERPQQKRAHRLRSGSTRFRDLAARGLVHNKHGYIESFIPGPKTQGVELNAFGMGEVVTSLRQLLKRYAWFTNSTGTTTDSAQHVYFPFVTSGNTNFVPNNHDNRINPYNTFYDRVSLLYRWMAGSLRMGFTAASDFPPNENIFSIKPGWLVSAEPANDGSRYIEVTPPICQIDRNGAQAQFFSELEQIVEFDIPFYQRNPAMLTGVGAPQPIDFDRSGYVSDRVPYNFGTVVTTSNKPSYQSWISTGEDFSFGYIIGPPISIVSYRPV
nr:MAG: structural polyprotein [Tuatara cloaca-associated dicistrovirus-3]